MKKNLLKPILGGVVVGLLLFFAGPFILLIFLLKFIFTPFGMGRMMGYRRFAYANNFYPPQRLEMADKIRNMNDDEYQAFKEKLSNRFNRNRC